jgi:hypothetical protein
MVGAIYSRVGPVVGKLPPARSSDRLAAQGRACSPVAPRFFLPVAKTVLHGLDMVLGFTVTQGSILGAEGLATPRVRQQMAGIQAPPKAASAGCKVDAQPCFIVSLFCAIGGLPAEALIAGPASQLGRTNIFATML